MAYTLKEFAQLDLGKAIDNLSKKKLDKNWKFEQLPDLICVGELIKSTENKEFKSRTYETSVHPYNRDNLSELAKVDLQRIFDKMTCTEEEAKKYDEYMNKPFKSCDFCDKSEETDLIDGKSTELMKFYEYKDSKLCRDCYSNELIIDDSMVGADELLKDTIEKGILSRDQVAQDIFGIKELPKDAKIIDSPRLEVKTKDGFYWLNSNTNELIYYNPQDFQPSTNFHERYKDKIVNRIDAHPGTKSVIDKFIEETEKGRDFSQGNQPPIYYPPVVFKKELIEKVKNTILDSLKTIDFANKPDFSVACVSGPNDEIIATIKYFPIQKETTAQWCERICREKTAFHAGTTVANDLVSIQPMSKPNFNVIKEMNEPITGVKNIHHHYCKCGHQKLQHRQFVNYSEFGACSWGECPCLSYREKNE